MIQIVDLHKQFSGQVVFENLAFNLQKGEKCGLIGRNGSGKSTLFSIILGRLTADQGQVSIPKNYKIAHLEQHIQFDEKTVIEECALVLEEAEKFDLYKAETILFGLGFTQKDLRKDPKSFSGGYQIRINLCKALLTNPSLLLLDEPTNYLDIVSLRWLRTFLKTFAGEVILITHDKEFMNSVTTHTMGISRKQLKKIKGSTQKYYEQLIQEDAIYEKTRLNQEKKKAHLESFVDRFSAKASKATQAQSKLKQLDKMNILTQLDTESNMGLKFQFKECPGKTLLEVQNLGFGYDPSHSLFSDISFTIGRQDKVGIIGKNGKGKSTLLNLLAGELTPSHGEISQHPLINKGHFGQTNVQRLTPENNIIEEIQSANQDLPQTTLRSICGSLMFSGESASKKIKILSGGEKNRVLLGKILANPTNLLLLDEPTNHLDMESIETLTQEIQNYPGAAILVTHNEALLKRVVNKLIIFQKDGAQFFKGNYEEFLEKIGWEEEELGKSRSTSKKGLSKKESHSLRSAIIKERSGYCIPLKKRLALLEESIISFEKDVELQNTLLESASAEGDSELILKSSMQIGSLDKKIQDSFSEMEILEEKLQEFNDKFEEKLNLL